MEPQPIPQCDPRASYEAQRVLIDEAVARVLSSGRFILGPEVEAFESEFAAFNHVSHAIGVASGTDALSLALEALGVGAGDAVITASHTAVATAVAIRSTGAIPIFADVDPVHGLIDPACVAELLSRASSKAPGFPANRIRAIVPVHLYGRCADMDALMPLAAAHGLAIVEDCAQAHGARFNGQLAGTFGAFGAFSFYPTKNLAAIGDGGALVTSDADLDRRIRLLREYGWRERYVSDVEGRNSRLDELQAAILRIKLRTLESDNRARQRIADLYRYAIAHPLVMLPPAGEPARHVYHQFAVRSDQRESLQQHLRGRGVGTLVHYPRPIHLQPAYADPRYAPLALPNTEAWAREVLSLPMYPQLGELAVAETARAINAWQPTVP